jgi:hypothetical protein
MFRVDEACRQGTNSVCVGCCNTTRGTDGRTRSDRTVVLPEQTILNCYLHFHHALLTRALYLEARYETCTYSPDEQPCMIEDGTTARLWGSNSTMARKGTRNLRPDGTGAAPRTVATSHPVPFPFQSSNRQPRACRWNSRPGTRTVDEGSGVEGKGKGKCRTGCSHRGRQKK